MLIIGTFIWSKNAEGADVITLTSATKKPIPQSSLEQLFRRIGEEKFVDWRLLMAHAKTESSLNPNAVNLEKPDTQDGSYGLMQIYVVWGKNGRPINRLNLPEWNNITEEKLLDPELNVRLGAGIIKENVDRYGMPRAIAVYNRYAERLQPQYGPFVNQKYVNRVLTFYKQLKKEFP